MQEPVAVPASLSLSLSSKDLSLANTSLHIASTCVCSVRDNNMMNDRRPLCIQYSIWPIYCEQGGRRCRRVRIASYPL